MPALPYLYQMLTTFRHLFSRRTPWLLFCLLIIGFIITPHLEGLTALGRFWITHDADYHRLLHFFHSNAWQLQPLIAHWSGLVLSQHVAVEVEGRKVLLGDHTAVVKDARRMPGVVTLHQHSETQSKPSYFRGHYWGVLGLLTGSLQEAFCTPLEARLHQGLVHIDPELPSQVDRDTQSTRLLHMALDFVKRHGIRAFLVLDAFFASAPVFALANSYWSIDLKQPFLYIVTRAKKSYVAYLIPQAPASPGLGRPRKYGDKIKLYEVFETYKAQFIEGWCQVYGHQETVSYLVLNLMWKPLKAPLRFVFAITSRGPIVLMSNDLALEPLVAISLYCARVRVETMFAMLKGLLGAFAYRFWSRYIERRSRKPKKHATLKAPLSDHLEAVQRTWQACEGFVMLGGIALGLLQLIALKFDSHIWSTFTRFLRTRRRTLPSERTVKVVLAQELLKDFYSLKPSAMMQEIRNLARHPDDPSQQVENHPDRQPQVA
jgi:hypothetical protein